VTTTKALRWTIADLDAFPQSSDGTRYEIIDGELFVSTQPSSQHQFTCGQATYELEAWNRVSLAGVVLPAPGLIFADDDNAAPDVVWASKSRLRSILWDDGKLHGPPELVIEVLSPGPENARRDRDVKLRLYSRHGINEYWIFDLKQHRADLYRRDAGDLSELRLAASLDENDELRSPPLPGVQIRVGNLFLTEDV